MSIRRSRHAPTLRPSNPPSDSKTPPGSPRKRLVLWIAAATLICASARAETFTWDGNNKDSIWTSIRTVGGMPKTNWDPEGIPGDADTAMIDGVPVIVPNFGASRPPVSVGTVQATGGLDVQGWFTIKQSAQIENLSLKWVLDAQGPVTLTGSQGQWHAGNFTGPGGVTNQGTFTQVGTAIAYSIEGGAFVNEGTFSAFTRAVELKTAFINKGIANLGGGMPMLYANGRVENHGTITVARASSIEAPLSNRGGIIEVSGQDVVLSLADTDFTGGQIKTTLGTLELYKNDHWLRETVEASGTGNLRLRSSVVVLDKLVANLSGEQGLDLTSGILSGSGAVVNKGHDASKTGSCRTTARFGIPGRSWICLTA